MTLFLILSSLTVLLAIYAVAMPHWQKGRRGAAAWYALLVVIVVLPLYIMLGAPGQLDQDSLQERSVEQLYKDVQRYMDSESGDADGWRLLANLGMSLGRYDDVVVAYQRLIDMNGEQPELLLGKADAMAMAAGGTLSGQPELLVRRALLADPDNTAALWMLSMSAYSNGELQQAVATWRQLWQLLDDDQQKLRLRQLLLAADVQPPPMLLLHLSIAPEATPPEPSLPVFVYARVPGGAAMPVAAVKLSAGELPATLLLDDSDMLIEGASLEDYQQLVVSARIATSGTVQSAPEDLVAVPTLLGTGQQAALQLSNRATTQRR